MRAVRKSLWVLVATTLWAAPARSAEDDQHLVATEETVEILLLRQKSVRKELKVTPEEAQKIRDFNNKQWERAQQLAKKDKEEQEKGFQEMTQENEKFLQECLKPEQRKRLKQIAMQRAGLLWVARSDVGRELELSDEQKQKVKDLHQEARKEAIEIFRSEDTRPVKREHLREMRKKNRERLMSILTDEQKNKWKEMIGEEFKGDLDFGGDRERGSDR